MELGQQVLLGEGAGVRAGELGQQVLHHWAGGGGRGRQQVLPGRGGVRAGDRAVELGQQVLLGWGGVGQGH